MQTEWSKYREALETASAEQEKELALLLREFKALTTTTGWLTFVRVIEVHINAAVDDMLLEVPSMERGELASYARALKLAVSLPYLTIEAAKNEKAATNPEDEPEEGLEDE